MSEVTIGTGAGQPKGRESATGGVNKRLTAVEGRLTSVEGQLTSVEGRLTSVENQLGTIVFRLTTLEGRVMTLETQMSEVKAAVAKLEAKVEEGFKRMATKEDLQKGINKMLFWCLGTMLAVVGIVLKFG